MDHATWIITYRRQRELGESPFEAAHACALIHDTYFQRIVDALGEEFQSDVRDWRAEA